MVQARFSIVSVWRKRGATDLLRGGRPDIYARPLVADPRAQGSVVEAQLVYDARQLQPCHNTRIWRAAEACLITLWKVCRGLSSFF